MKRFLVGCILAAVALAGCKGRTSETSSSTSTTATTVTPSGGTTAGADTMAHEITTRSGLKYQDEVVGSGPLAENGMTATVHYTGWLTDGTEFDSSLKSGRPLPFRIGAGQVIRGWDEGVKGMRVGGKRRLTVPPDLAYGDQGAAPLIPPNATLVFEVELLNVK